MTAEAEAPYAARALIAVSCAVTPTSSHCPRRRPGRRRAQRGSRSLPGGGCAHATASIWGGRRADVGQCHRWRRHLCAAGRWLSGEEFGGANAGGWSPHRACCSRSAQGCCTSRCSCRTSPRTASEWGACLMPPRSNPGSCPLHTASTRCSATLEAYTAPHPHHSSWPPQYRPSLAPFQHAATSHQIHAWAGKQSCTMGPPPRRGLAKPCSASCLLAHRRMSHRCAEGAR